MKGISTANTATCSNSTVQVTPVNEIDMPRSKHKPTCAHVGTYSGSHGLTIVFFCISNVYVLINQQKYRAQLCSAGICQLRHPSQCPCFLQEFIAACSSNAEFSFTCSSLGWWLQKCSFEFAFEDRLPEMQPLESQKTLAWGLVGAKRKQKKIKGGC